MRKHLWIALVFTALGLLCLSGIACLPTSPSPGCRFVVTPKFEHRQASIVNGRVVILTITAPKATTEVCEG